MHLQRYAMITINDIKSRQFCSQCETLIHNFLENIKIRITFAG